MQYVIKFLASGVLALSVGSLSASAQAADASPTPGQQLQQIVPMNTTGVELLVSSRGQYGNNLVAVSSGFQAIDVATTVVCPASTRCVIRAEQNVQVRGTVAGNKWAICTQVDGNFMAQPSCPFQGVIPSDGTFVAGSFAQNKTGVTPGTHTVQTFLFTDAGADRSIYEIQYQVYRR
jgi:hypothetical protein